MVLLVKTVYIAIQIFVFVVKPPHAGEKRCHLSESAYSVTRILATLW
jgi:hypothetical protein